MIEVILSEDVKTLGKAGTMVRVRPGYARNFLLPQGLAYEATEWNKKRIAGEARARGVRLDADRAEASKLASVLSAVHMELKGKAGEGDRLFGSITSQDVADALAARGHIVDKRKLDLEHPIKTLGEHTVHVRLHPDVGASVRITVVPE